MRTQPRPPRLNRSLGILCLFAALVSGWIHSHGAEQKRPNVLLILADNQSYFELSCHGHEQVQTPRIDQLASESVDFVNFHAPPFCFSNRAKVFRVTCYSIGQPNLSRRTGRSRFSVSFRRRFSWLEFQKRLELGRSLWFRLVFACPGVLVLV